ncbi:hypothetical protein I0Q91_09705 [Halanaerobiaceae bacterium Z-7014]|uniref:Putative regulatory protein FmdB zinc ribbon domain-containing protein n=1 Tax=Halonatronomonas betaini TaxID=2778430 RepID=A0A931FA91_9FIRM|nr:FmdB family zinc ribbon protein [Halonatronomonas betaini]MBF8437354.1 hypothetical protein [Halonatronomonas betaini]
MPNYSFKCRDCENTSSITAKISEVGDGLEAECPECGSNDTYQSFDGIGIMSCNSSGRAAFS